MLQVKESAKLRQIMQTILTLGNALNQGTARGYIYNSYSFAVFMIFFSVASFGNVLPFVLQGLLWVSNWIVFLNYPTLVQEITK